MPPTANPRAHARRRRAIVTGTALLVVAAIASAGFFRDLLLARWPERWAPRWLQAEIQEYRLERKPRRTARKPPPKPAPEPEPSSPPMLADIALDLSYVDRTSPAYTRFKQWVDDAVAGNPGYAFDGSDGAIMYRLTGEQKYCDLAIRQSEQQVAAAEAEIAAGRVPDVAGDSYLEVGTLIAEVSLTLDTCYRSIPAQQQQRWSNYAEQAVWNLWNYDNAKWGTRAAPWSGWSTDNPGNNYHYSFLEATMFWALAYGRHQTWMNDLTSVRLPPVQQYFAATPGGGSREGTGYGVSHRRLFTLYRIWRNATRTDLANANSHLTDSVHYWVHATVPTLDRYAPIGDQARSSSPDLFDYHRHLLLEARYMTPNARAREIASWWLNNISVPQMDQGFNFRHDLLPAGTGGTPPTELLHHASGTGHLFARSGWDRDAMWLSFVAGPYVESHAHQDQGSFTLFSKDWMAVTWNIWSDSGLEQETDMHNVVRFAKIGAGSLCTSSNPGTVVAQRESTSTMVVTPAGGSAFAADANLTPAYSSNSGVTSWKRRLDFASRKLTVSDQFQLGANMCAIYQTHVPTQPTISGTQVTTNRMRMRVLAPANPTITVVSMGGGAYRIEVRGSGTGYTVEYTEI